MQSVESVINVGKVYTKYFDLRRLLHHCLYGELHEDYLDLLLDVYN